ncbi:MAG: GIY-YIG nuclease family protein [Opitutales bacterium]|nr:GIY-YIG nuclease family protein [Opitutales bacterium]
MTKQEIIKQIKSLAENNSGKAPGVQRFEKETGIKRSTWYPKIWLRWGDALNEAGYSRNSLVTAFDKEFLILHYISLIRELKHFPVAGELRLKKKEDSSFPSHNVFNQLGGKAQRASVILEYCSTNDGYDDIIPYCETIASNTEPVENDSSPKTKIGYVYLIKHGNRNEYKIGMTYNPLRREGEIRLELPEKIEPIHTIATDDPHGIEQYWHKRFKEKRKEGEWFELSSDDVKAFKKWKRIH